MATKRKNTLGNFLHVRMERRDIEACEKAAETLRISLSDWVRMTLIEKAKKQQ